MKLKFKRKLIGILGIPSILALPIVLSVSEKDENEEKEELVDPAIEEETTSKDTKKTQFNEIGKFLQLKSSFDALIDYFEQNTKVFINSSNKTKYLGFSVLNKWVEQFKAENNKFDQFIKEYQSKEASDSTTSEYAKKLENMGRILESWRDALYRISKDALETYDFLTALDAEQIDYKGTYFNNFKAVIDKIDQELASGDLKAFKMPETFTTVDSYTDEIKMSAIKLAEQITTAINTRKQNDINNIIDDLNTYVSILKIAVDENKTYEEKVNDIEAFHNVKSDETQDSKNTDSIWFAKSKEQLISLLSEIKLVEDKLANKKHLFAEVNKVLEANHLNVTINPDDKENSLANLREKLNELLKTKENADGIREAYTRRLNEIWTVVGISAVLLVIVVILLVQLKKTRNLQKANKELEGQSA